MRRILLGLLVMALAGAVGCATTGYAAPLDEIGQTPAAQMVETLPATAEPSSTNTPSPSPSATLTPSFTASPTMTLTPTLTPSPTWQTAFAGEVYAPILLYHRVVEGQENNRYAVSPTAFEEQMRYLAENGYTTITPAYLARVIVAGGHLPERPVLITFDDGYADTYTNAFPIMEKYGLKGAVYVITSYVDVPGRVNQEQLRDLASHGWEIGSHTMTHADLVQHHERASMELSQSRQILEKWLGNPVWTIAYPYGKADEYILNRTKRYGFTAGMGLGILNRHTSATLYYLSRREVRSEYTLDQFIELLSAPQP